MMNKKVSVIVPVYNVNQYLEECVNSIIAQSYRNIEIILVDDGSTDDSSKMCDSFKKIDDRIIVIHKKNGGLSDARNAGLEIMTGDYVTFVDSDDYLSKESIALLIKAVDINSSDMVFTKDGCRFSDNEIVKLSENIGDVNSPKLYSKKEILNYLFYQRTNIMGAPGKLYKSFLFKEQNIRFPYGVYYEDLATTYRLVLKSNHVTMIDEKLYAYRMRSDGIIHQNFSEKKLTCIQVTNKLYSDIKKEMPEVLKAAASRCCSCNRMVYSQIPYNKKVERDKIWKEIKKYRRIVLFDKNARKRERFSCLVGYLGQGCFYVFNIAFQKFKYDIFKR